MKLSGVVAAGTVAALLVVPSAAAKILTLNWVEKASGDQYPAAMTFRVKSVTLTRKSWATHASFTNRSSKTIRIVKPTDTYPPEYTFGLGWASACKPPAIACALDTRNRTYSKPSLPTLLRPGQTWSGVFGGPGLPKKGLLVYVLFGHFLLPDGKDFDWITTHSFRL